MSIRIMPLGDSTTRGWNLGSGGYRWPLLGCLKAAGIDAVYVGGESSGNPLDANGNPRTDLNHQGINGRTTAGILADIQAGILTAYPADVLLLMVGANDPLNGVSLAQSAANYAALLAAAFSARPGVRIVAKGVSVGAQYAAQFSPYNAAWLAACVAITGQAINYLAPTNIPDAWLTDGIHRKVEGYNLDALDFATWLARVLQS